MIYIEEIYKYNIQQKKEVAISLIMKIQTIIIVLEFCNFLYIKPFV